MPEIRIIQETYIWSKSYRDRTLNLRLGFQCVAECTIVISFCECTIVTRMIDCLVHFGDPLLHPCYRAPRRCSALPLNHWRPGEVARAVQQHTHHQCNKVVTVQQFIHKVHWSCNSATISLSLFLSALPNIVSMYISSVHPSLNNATTYIPGTAHCLAPWESRHATNLDRCLSLRDAIDSLLTNRVRGRCLLSLIVLRTMC